MQRKKAQLFWDILSHLDLSRCVCGECYDYYQKCHNSLPHCVIVWVLWCEDSSASAVRYSEYYPPPAHNYFSLHFLSDILLLWIFNIPKVMLTIFLIIPSQFDILNCDIFNMPPLLRFAEEESEAKLNKVILVSWKSYSQSLPLLLSKTNSSIEAFPTQTGVPHTNI